MLSSNEYKIKFQHQNQRMANIEKEIDENMSAFMHPFADYRNSF